MENKEAPVSFYVLASFGLLFLVFGCCYQSFIKSEQCVDAAEEIEELSSRWEVVLLLDKGDSYREIAKKTKVSTTTVTRIAQWLNNGEGGYKAVLNNNLKGKK